MHYITGRRPNLADFQTNWFEFHTLGLTAADLWNNLAHGTSYSILENSLEGVYWLNIFHYKNFKKNKCWGKFYCEHTNSI